jgi:GH15 family glucan-1,4-alpha-glucosidase
MSEPLEQYSRMIILSNQQPNGAYLACPNMPDYRFSWFRDGAYISYALTLDGEKNGISHGGSMAAQWESAIKFHDWCAGIINKRAERLERAIEYAQKGQQPAPGDILNARYADDGQEGPGDWPEFQLDGPGTWLWSLAEYAHYARIKPLPLAWQRAVDLAARYLAALWPIPCYDCWEERGRNVHISTLASIYAGLRAAQRLMPGLDFEETTELIRQFVLSQGLTPGGELAKSVGLDQVDANLISVAVPNRLFAPDDPVMRRTVARIERELHVSGSGIYRHVEDTYYGGGPWVLLALWLAWYYVEAGEAGRAQSLVEWAERQADAQGNLPEQVNAPLLSPSYYAGWVAQRGPIANPLLWSHAEYLIVRRKLNR